MYTYNAVEMLSRVRKRLAPAAGVSKVYEVWDVWRAVHNLYAMRRGMAWLMQRS